MILVIVYFKQEHNKMPGIKVLISEIRPEASDENFFVLQQAFHAFLDLTGPKCNLLKSWIMNNVLRLDLFPAAIWLPRVNRPRDKHHSLAKLEDSLNLLECRIQSA